MAVDTPGPIPEVPAVEKLLQCLVAETQSRLSPVVSPPSVGLEKMLRSFQDPGGRAMPIVTPRRMTNNDVSNTPKLSGGGGGGLSWSPPEFSVVLVEETNAADTSGRECPCDDQEKRPLAGTRKWDCV